MKKSILHEATTRIADSVDFVENQEKLARCLQAVSKHEAIVDSYDKGVVAQLLQNFYTTYMSRVSDSVDGTTRGQQVNISKDFGPFVPEVLPIIMAWYPEMPLKDLISIQPMKQALDYIVFSKLVTGTNKAPTLVGQEVETPMGMRKINGYYPTGVIVGEQFPGQQLEIDNNSLIGATAYYALRTDADSMSRFKLTVTNAGAVTVYRAAGVSGQNILLANAENPDDPVAGAVWQIASGAFFLPIEAENTDNISVVANYVWDLDFAVDENIPKVKEQVDYFPMTAQPRAIAYQWTIFAEAIRKAQFGRSIREENTKRVLNLLYQYQVRFILDEMFEDARGSLGTITLPSAGMYSLDVMYNNVMQQLNTAATNLEYQSGLQSGNRIVCGSIFKNWCESLPNTMFQKTARPSGYSTAREIGRLGEFIVFFDPNRAPGDIMMSYRGDDWWMAPYYLGIFLPLVPTDALAFNITVREAFADMCAYKYMFPQFVLTGTVERAVAAGA